MLVTFAAHGVSVMVCTDNLTDGGNMLGTCGKFVKMFIKYSDAYLRKCMKML